VNPRSGLDERPGREHDRAMRGRTFLTAIVLCAASVPATADEAPICAARPGKATPPCTVPTGHWQIETGFVDWTLQKAEGERDTALVIGETTIKYGLTDRSDIEVDVTPWQRATSRGPGFHDQASGIGDVVVAYKQQLTGGSAPLQVSAMPYVKIPTAGHALGNGRWEGGLLVPIAYSLPNTPLSVGLTPELDLVADGDGAGRHAAMVQVASLGWQATDKLNLSAEIWGQWDWDPAGTTRQASADAAAAYLVSNRVQVDAGANFGLNKATPNAELYGGLSVLF
jgi:hypothetical protein